MRIIVCAVLWAMVLVGCGAKTPSGPNTVTAGNGGRNVKAVVTGPVWVKPDADKFVVSVTGHEIIIEKERVLVDGVASAKVSASATQFDVGYTNGALSVKADGTEVLSTTLKQ